MLEIFEQEEQWIEDFQQGWVKHLEATGEIDRSLYGRVKNSQLIPGKAIDLSAGKVLFISTGGSYLAASQEPFFDSDETHPQGDYSIRTYSIETPFDELAIAHSHYDHAAVNADRQVLLPFRRLTDMVEEGFIGAVCDTVISYAGYQPNAARVTDELLPAIQAVVEREKPDAVLLVPA